MGDWMSPVDEEDEDRDDELVEGTGAAPLYARA